MDSVPTPATGADAPALPAFASLFEGDLDLDALERMLLAWLVHPQGGDCAQAWLLIWNARRDLVEGWREAAAADAPPALDVAMAQARRAAPDTPEGAVRAWAEAPDDLGEPLATAWRGATFARGEAAAGSGPWSGDEPVAALTLKRGARGYGLVVVRSARGADAAERLEAFRRVADAALASQARGAEARRRARQQAALAEFARTSVSAINLAEALHLLARGATQALGVRGAAVYRCGPAGPCRLEVSYGPPSLREAFAEGFAPLAAEIAAQGHPAEGERGDEAATLPPGVAGEVTAWSLVPLVAYGRRQGALLVWDGLDRHPASPELEAGEREFLATLGDQAGLLLEHARLLEGVRTAERQRADLAARVRATERLAAVGELAQRVARESRNPIASISAFARRAQRELAEDDPQREYLEIVVRETERLDAMLREQLEYAQLPAGRLRMQALNVIVQEALQRVSETLVRRRVRLVRKLGSGLPELLLDESRIRRVVENIIAYSLESVPVGGRIQVSTRRVGEHVAVEIAHDGSRGAGDLLEQLFVPFSTGSGGGAAVGLGVAQQIVREHGGEIRVRGEGDWGTVFAFTLPVAGNEDRRRARERRSPRGDRRRGDAGGSDGSGAV